MEPAASSDVVVDDEREGEGREGEPETVPNPEIGQSKGGQNDDDVVLMEGNLWKRSMYLKRWTRRYFELRRRRGLVYKSNEKSVGYRGEIPVAIWQSVGLLPKIKSHVNWTGFYVHTSEDSIALASETLEEAQHWVSCLVSLFKEGNRSPLVQTPLAGPTIARVDSSEEASPSPLAASPPDDQSQRRPSFSLSAPFRPRSQTLVETQAAADHEEQFSLVSGMMQDIVDKRDILIQELKDKVEELQESVKDAKDTVAGLQLERIDLRDRLKAVEKEKDQLAHDLEESQRDKRVIQEELERRTRAHSDLEVRHIELEAQMGEVSEVLTTPFWKSPKR